MKDIENKLVNIFQIVNDSQKFAETKNAGLLTLSGAATAALLSFLGTSTSITCEWKIGLTITLVLFCLTTILCILSFLPKTNHEKLLSKCKGITSDTDNFYYFGHLCKYTPEKLTTSIARLYFNTQIESAYEKKNCNDISAQIIVNSRITSYKYKLFKLSAWISFSGVIVVFIVPFTIKLILKL